MNIVLCIRDFQLCFFTPKNYSEREKERERCASESGGKLDSIFIRSLFSLLEWKRESMRGNECGNLGFVSDCSSFSPENRSYYLSNSEKQTSQSRSKIFRTNPWPEIWTSNLRIEGGYSDESFIYLFLVD